MTTKTDREDTIEYLRSLLKPGDTVFCVLRHVSQSGMSRVISLHILKDNDHINISYRAGQLLEGYDSKHNGCKAGGCGMDMGFHLVYTLSRILFRGGFTCPGATCPSNDHSNPPYPPRDGTMQHTGDGGYALNYRWM